MFQSHHSGYFRGCHSHRPRAYCAPACGRLALTAQLPRYASSSRTQCSEHPLQAATRPRSSYSGFTLLEVLLSIVILSIGLLALARLMSQTLSTAMQSRYTSLASTLASEKLEDLDRWAAIDPHVAVTSGTTAGSLTADILQNITVGTNTESVNYFDEVTVGANAGAFSEIVSGLDAQGNKIYTSTSHTPNGAVTVTSSPTAPASFNFKRRWLIESNVPIAGVRRITVLVTSQDPGLPAPVSFQMSMVRP
jgi:prepilin-type N-terminal cleavage/methylation domain-containing protein